MFTSVKFVVDAIEIIFDTELLKNKPNKWPKRRHKEMFNAFDKTVIINRIFAYLNQYYFYCSSAGEFS